MEGKTTSCPAESPYLNQDNECISCQGDLVYDISLKQCTSCPEGTTFNQDSHECEKQAMASPIPEDECSGENMVWNGTDCIKC